MEREEYINQQPEQFKDDIDKWLFTEFGTIGGCCSAEKSHEYSIARMVAEKLTDAFIEKACEWIKENLLKHTYVYEGEVGIGMAVFLEEFKQAMKVE